ncbi:hypothetical protein ACWIGI_20730 [Nocardia sp. NPDC055321]
MRGQHRILTGLVVAVFVAVAFVVSSRVLTAHEEAVDRLDTELSAMPGVLRVDAAVYAGVLAGDGLLSVVAYVPDATDQQIGDVFVRLGERIGDFGGLRERDIEFVVGDRARIRVGDALDLDPFLATVRNIRGYTAAVPGARIAWTAGPTPRIAIVDVASGAAEPLAAVRAMVGGAAADVTIETADHGNWNVALPLSVDRESELLRQLSDIPWGIKFVAIENGRIEKLSLRATTTVPLDPDRAYGELAGAVRILGPTADHPVRLTWNWFDNTGDERNGGFVHAAGCEYPPSAVSADAISASALVVQRRMREEFEFCH